jgi:hypothetical protein
MHPGRWGFTADDAQKAFATGAGAITVDTPGLTKQIPGQKQNIGLPDCRVTPQRQSAETEGKQQTAASDDHIPSPY